MRYDYFCFRADPSPLQFFTEQLAIFFCSASIDALQVASTLLAITGIGTYVAPILALSIHGSPKERNVANIPAEVSLGKNITINKVICCDQRTLHEKTELCLMPRNDCGCSSCSITICRHGM